MSSVSEDSVEDRLLHVSEQLRLPTNTLQITQVRLGQLRNKPEIDEGNVDDFVAAALALSAREGRPAGEALVTMSDHVETLDEVQQESRRAVGQVTSTLSNTAAIFGPLVGGATVALTDVMGTGGRLGGSVAVDALGLAVGWYVLFLAVVLTTLATGLTHGFDRSLVGYRVGLAVLAATATYITAVVGTGLVV